MSYEFRLPNITAPDADGKIAQLQSFLHQLIQEMNWAFNSIADISEMKNVAPEVSSRNQTYTDSVISNANVARREIDELRDYIKTLSNAVEIGSTRDGAYNSYAKFENGKISLLEDTEVNSVASFGSEKVSLLKPVEMTWATNEIEGEITDFAEGCEDGITTFSGGVGIGMVMKNNDMITVNLFLFTGEISVKTYKDNVWSEWMYLEPVQRGEE